MKAKPPADRHSFANEWDEIGYLYDKVLFWLYQRADRRKARPFVKRLELLLAKADPKQESILGQECRSLAREALGDLAGAIEHRENEIQLIRRLHDVSRGKPFEEHALQDYGHEELSDRLDLLASLYHDNGQLDKAIDTLKQSKRLCQDHGLTFDGADLLQDYLDEQRSAQDTTKTRAAAKASSK
jgi:hypothetical protein